MIYVTEVCNKVVAELSKKSLISKIKRILDRKFLFLIQKVPKAQNVGILIVHYYLL